MPQGAPGAARPMLKPPPSSPSQKPTQPPPSLQSPPPTTISELSDDLLLIILGHTDWRSVLRAGTVSTRWLAVSRHPALVAAFARDLQLARLARRRDAPRCFAGHSGWVMAVVRPLCWLFRSTRRAFVGERASGALSDSRCHGFCRHAWGLRARFSCSCHAVRCGLTRLATALPPAGTGRR